MSIIQNYRITTDEYLIDIIPRAASAGISVNAKIESNNLLSCNLKAEFDKYPFNFYNNSCNIKLLINGIDDLLITQLTEPIIAKTVNVSGAGINKDITINLSNVIIVRLNNVLEQVMFVGVQNEVKFNRNEIEIGFQNITRFVSENLQCEIAEDLDCTYYDDALLFYTLLQEVSSKFNMLGVIKNPLLDTKYKFISIKNLFNIFEFYYSAYFKALFKVASYQVLFDLPNNNNLFYKQSYTTSNKGTAINSFDNLFLPLLDVDDTEIIDSFFQQLSYNLIFDFLKDFADTFLCSITTNFGSAIAAVRFRSIYDADLSTFTVSNADLTNETFAPYSLADRLKLSKSVNQNSSINNIEFQNEGFEGSVTYVTNNIFNINLQVGTYTFNIDGAKNTAFINLLLNPDSKVLLNTLFYYDTTIPAGFSAPSNTGYVKVYDNYVISLNNLNIDSEDLIGYDATILTDLHTQIRVLLNLNVNTKGRNDAFETWFETIQSNYSCSYYLAKTMLDLFSRQTVANIEFDLLTVKSLVHFAAIQQPLFIDLEYLDLLPAPFQTLPNLFTVTSYENEIINNHIAKIKAINKGE